MSASGLGFAAQKRKLLWGNKAAEGDAAKVSNRHHQLLIDAAINTYYPIQMARLSKKAYNILLNFDWLGHAATIMSLHC